MNKIALIALPLMLQLSVVCFSQEKSTQQAKKKAPIRNAEIGAYKVELLDNSKILSQAVAVNSKGNVIGMRQITNAAMTIFDSRYFFANQKDSIDIKTPKEFTNLEAFALSDNDLVVGLTSRPLGDSRGSLRGFAWNAKNEELQLLLPLEGDIASHAQDVDSAGKVVVGYSTGAEPAPQIRSVVWELQEDGKWAASLLPCKDSYNPYIVLSRVIVSPDGKTIAACCTERRSEFGQVDSQLYHWTRKDGKWAGKVISKEQYHLRDMNNEKQIAGSYASPGGPMPCRINSNGSVDKIELLKGDESGEAWGITPTGEVVGLSDDPRGPKGGPQAFMWSNGKTKKIDFGDSPYSAAYSINEKGQIAGLVDVLEPEEKTIGFRTK